MLVSSIIKILIYLPVSELTCILSSAYKKEKVSEHPPGKLCTLRPWSLNHGYILMTGPICLAKSQQHWNLPKKEVATVCEQSLINL